MEPLLHPGPLKEDVLTLQKTHKSQAVWDGQEVRPLRCRSHLVMHKSFRVSARVVDAIRGTQFYGIHRLCSVRFDVDLVSALVERWRQETHSFHLTVGEATITLQDVQVLLGLKIGGNVVSGSSLPNWVDVVREAFGVDPPDGVLKGSSLKFSWLMKNFRVVDEDSSPEHLERCVRAYVLILFATILFPDKSGDDINVIYLPLLMNLDEMGNYSWASAVLATLYRNLCRASLAKSKEIGGPLILLQLWAWERIAIGRPTIGTCRLEHDHDIGVHPLGSQHQLRVDPLGCKWLRVNRTRAEGTSSLLAYRDAFDSMTDDQFLWQPYTRTILSFLPDECHNEQEDWVVVAPLICFNIVEWHYPDRVVRQFGWKQEIPQPCDTVEKLHKVDKRGGSSKCWSTEHKIYINLWNNRRSSKATGDPTETFIMRYHDSYMIWYREHTRLFVNSLAHRQATTYHPSAGPMHLLTNCLAKWNQKFAKEVKAMSQEFPPHYRSLLTEYNIESSRCLEQVGFAHLLQPMQDLNLEDTQVNVRDDTPPLDLSRRPIQPPHPPSPVVEEDIVQPLTRKRKSTRQNKKKKKT